MDNDVPDQIIDGYRIWCKDTTSRGGGVAVYLRDHLHYTVKRGIVDYGLEVICIEIRPLKCRPFILVAWYGPPNDPFSSFDLLEKVLSLIGKTKESSLLEIEIVIFGTKLLIVTLIPYIY